MSVEILRCREVVMSVERIKNVEEVGKIVECWKLSKLKVVDER